MTWNELAEFIASLPADQRTRVVEVRPDPVAPPTMPPLLFVGQGMPTVGGYKRPCLFVSEPP